MRFPGIAWALLSPQSFCMLVTHWSPKIRSHGTAGIIIVSSSVSLLDTLFWYCSYNHWLIRCYFASCWLTRHGLRWLNCCCAPLRLVVDLLIIIAGYSGYASLVPLKLLVCGLLAHRTWCMVAQGLVLQHYSCIYCFVSHLFVRCWPTEYCLQSFKMRSFGLTIIVLLQFCYTTGAVIGLLDRAYNLLSTQTCRLRALSANHNPPYRRKKAKFGFVSCQLYVMYV